MWVYNNLWVVGYYSPDGEWHDIREYATEAAAAKRVHYLNGGNYVKEDET